MASTVRAVRKKLSLHQRRRLFWVNFVLFCLAMCWLRYKFDSVWPAILAHNADNGVFVIPSDLTLRLRQDQG